MGFESVALVDLDEARIRQEDRLVSTCLHRLRDADGIQRGAEGGLGKECERLLRHGVQPPLNPTFDLRRVDTSSCLLPSIGDEPQHQE